MRCPSCGLENPETAETCACGFGLLAARTERAQRELEELRAMLADPAPAPAAVQPRPDPPVPPRPSASGSTRTGCVIVFVVCGFFLVTCITCDAAEKITDRIARRSVECECDGLDENEVRNIIADEARSIAADEAADAVRRHELLDH